MSRKSLSFFALISLVAAMLVMSATPASAADITVTTTTDGGAGSLRDAFDQANANAGPDTIILGAGLTYDLTLAGDDNTNAGGDLDSTEGAITIEGNGSTIRQTVDSRVIHQTASALMEVRDVTITGGSATDDGGGILSEGSIVVVDSTITGNEAVDNGGGLYAENDTISVTRSTISGNNASGGNGGGIYNYDAGPLVVVESTISGNSAFFDGGGLYSYDDIEIQNSTVTGNTAEGDGGGIFLEAYDLIGSFLTISGNNSSGGANVDLGAGGVLSLFGSVISNPLGGGPNCDGFGSGTSGGYNYEADGDTCRFDDATDVADGADPELGALAGNGGPTQTMLPADSSPLLDQIPSSDGRCTGTDQRGITRPQVDGCDIGAVEVEAEPEPTTTTTTPLAQPVALVPAFTG